MRDMYMIKTPKGWVGRYNMTDPLFDDCPQQSGYTYRDRESAEQVAAQFPGSVVVLVVPGVDRDRPALRPAESMNGTSERSITRTATP